MTTKHHLILTLTIRSGTLLPRSLIEANGFLELFKRNTQGKLEEKGTHFMDEIFDSAQQMERLPEDLLSFSRMGRAEMMRTSVSLDRLAQKALRILLNEAEERDIIWDIKPLPEVRGDAVMLQMVITNLISNALKFTRPRKQAIIEIGSIQPESEPVIYVKITGPALT
jgi:light-regulated signal transduction histidine kinase (bacteriophytochrome)